MTLDINDLFTPAPSGVGPNVPVTGTWLATLIQIAVDVGLDTTSWQPGSLPSTILSIDANALAQQDAIISLLAQAGFLDYAATGVVSYVAANGQTVTQPVTPDPSILSQNATGALGWLDVLADSVYDVQRIPATYASGILAIANTSASTYGPFLAGTYHVSNSITNATFANTASLTIAPGANVAISNIVNGPPSVITTGSPHGLSTGNYVYITGVGGTLGINGNTYLVTVTSSTTFNITASLSGSYTASTGTVYLAQTTEIQADVQGQSGTSVSGDINNTITKNNGVVVTNPGGLVGQPWESNTKLAARCRLKLGALSPNGPRAAYQYFALSTNLFSEAVVGYLPSSDILNVLVQARTQFGDVTVTVSNANPASSTLGGAVVAGAAADSVTGATNASPIRLSTALPHNVPVSTNMDVFVSGVLGNTAANGHWLATPDLSGNPVLDLLLIGSAGNGTYSAGTGSVEVGDLGAVDAVLQANVVPDAITLVTKSALAFPVTLVATVIVPVNKVTEYTANVTTQLQAFITALPIGGNTGGIRINDIIGVLFQAGSVNSQPSYVNNSSGITLNGVAADLAFPASNYVAVLQPLTGLSIQGS